MGSMEHHHGQRMESESGSTCLELESVRD
jgi:hypothetical protein